MTGTTVLGCSNFFYVHSENMEEVCKLLFNYVGLTVEVLGPNEIAVYSTPAYDETFRLAEMAFQMNFQQKKGFVCPLCETLGETVCGHLTFTSKI